MHAEDRMAMFKKAGYDDRLDIASPARSRQTRSVRSKNRSVIEPTLAIKGDLSALVIEGHIEGTIAHHKKHLTVGKQGRVKADIHANTVIVLGQLIGDIHSEGMVSLAKGADVEGDIFCSRIAMEEGARFKGKIDMREPPKETVVPKEPLQAEPVRTDKSNKVAGQMTKSSLS